MQTQNKQLNFCPDLSITSTYVSESYLDPQFGGTSSPNGQYVRIICALNMRHYTIKITPAEFNAFLLPSTHAFSPRSVTDVDIFFCLSFFVEMLQ